MDGWITHGPSCVLILQAYLLVAKQLLLCCYNEEQSPTQEVNPVAHFICTTCGTQYPESQQPPSGCSICEEPRQFVKATGQQWTTLERLRLTNRNSIKFKEPGLIAVGIDPHFAIGQRALLLRSPGGNILWDCLPLLDQAVVDCFQALGGISAIAISHPHYYSSMVEWSRAFGGVPIYLHADDHQWVMRLGNST